MDSDHLVIALQAIAYPIEPTDHIYFNVEDNGLEPISTRCRRVIIAFIRIPHLFLSIVLDSNQFLYRRTSRGRLTFTDY